MEKPSHHRPRILIVEDDSVTAHDIRSALERHGFPILGPAKTREEAEAIVESESVDLAILDVKLDTLDGGIEISRNLQERNEIPSLFVTGYSREAVFSKIDSKLSVGFLRKPFSDEELLACVESAADSETSNRELLHQLPGLESMAQRLGEPVLIADRSGSIRFANAAAEEIMGWPGEEVRDRPLEEILIPSENGSDNPSEEDQRRVSLTTRSGTPWLGRERMSPIKSMSGDLIGTISFLSSDASEMAPTEETQEHTAEAFEPPPAARSSALQKIASLAQDPAFRELIRKPPVPSAETKSSSIPVPIIAEQNETPQETGSAWELVDDPVLKIDQEGTILRCNGSAQFILGDSSPLQGSPLRDLFAPTDYESHESDFLKPFTDGKKHCFELRDERRERKFEIRVYRTGDELLLLFSESSDSEKQEWVRQQRLEGLGLLARGFAHDFNNHLTTITGNVSLARERHLDDDDLHQMLGEAQTAASRATGLVQQLMTFAQGGRPIRKRTRVPDLVRRILTEHRLQHPEIRFQFQGAEVDLVANIDPAQISRLIENLVANSAVAMSEGGILIVRCARISPEQAIEIRDTHIPADEDHLLIEVIDTGHGMDEESLNQVFEPYFTTRKQDNASGIGLTVCESIARAHGGFIQLQSKEGKGTIATFCAPVGRALEADAQDAHVQSENLPTIPVLENPSLQLSAEGDNILVGTRILILEDDAPIRRLMAATLRRAGHEVFETKDGRETVEVYKEAMERNAKFHLLICDLTIENGMGGVETMRQLTQLDPSILAIVSSGYSDAPAMSSPASFGFRGVLPKPYAPSELRAAVHRVLSAHRIIA